MAESGRYRSHFVNRYGEEWEFEYFPEWKEGMLRGSDVDWQCHPVIGGLAPTLVLNEEEILWLRQAWREATRPDGS